MKRIISLLFLSSIFFVIIIFALGLKTKKIYDTRDLVGNPISEFNLQLLNEDKTINTENLKKNNFTLINFWASWCAPCRKEHRHLITLSKNENLKILGINFKDEKFKANKFLKDLGNPFYIIASDTKGKTSISFGVYGIPETILINKDLIILKKYIGPINEKDVKKILKLVNKK
tara:strand:- start:396 stop:917 length:522 start_codon:yes stop_codon:yes gene_type:complete